MEKLNQTNGFIPTPAQQRLIEVLCNPENMGKSVREKCKLAEIAPPTYYEAIKIPAFLELIRDFSLELVKAKVADIMEATYKFAMENPRNSADRKIILEMAGAYREKIEQQMTGKDGEQINVVFNVARPPKKENLP